MIAYFVRHARAGERTASPEDRSRPLTGKGRRQAEKIAERLGELPITAVYASPFIRCVETVTPLAARLGLEVRESAALAEGHGVDEALSLVREHAGGDCALCTHGDVMSELVRRLLRRDLIGAHDPAGIDKAGTWAVTVDETGEPVSARYLPAPEV